MQCAMHGTLPQRGIPAAVRLEGCLLTISQTVMLKRCFNSGPDEKIVRDAVSPHIEATIFVLGL